MLKISLKIVLTRKISFTPTNLIAICQAVYPGMGKELKTDILCCWRRNFPCLKNWVLPVHSALILAIQGKWKRWNADTEVRKQKYRNKKKGHLLVSVPYWLTTAPCSQKMSVSKWCKSQILGPQNPINIVVYDRVSVVSRDYGVYLLVSQEYLVKPLVKILSKEPPANTFTSVSLSSGA